MKKTFLVAAFCVMAAALLPARAYCQDEPPKAAYIAANIPDSLKDNANSVVRYSWQSMDVKGPGKVINKIHTIITILNEKADRQAVISLPYNKKFSTVSSFEMCVYDAKGALIKKYHKGDMYEHAAEDDITLVTDDKILLIGHEISAYPTTVEYSYEIDENSVIDLGEWQIEASDQSIQDSYCQVSISSDAGFRYFDKNINLTPKKTTSDNTDTYSWHASNLKAIKMEEGSMAWAVLPKIEFAMNKFEFYGYPGDFSSWQNFGKWIQALNADVCTLNPARQAEIRQMTANLKTDKEKAEFLYHYVQQNMRYVNITLGIGGLKPFPADFVDQKKYGDCKALSNYMCAMLKAVNIPAYYAIVNAGNNGEAMAPAFPYDISDHIIVCIPFKNDTTWLECTSNTQPFGKLSPFTENRNAIIITEDGGKLVNTPKSTVEDNQFNSEVHLTLNADGSAKAQVKILGTGVYRDEYLDLAAAKLDDQKAAMMQLLNIKQPSVFDYKAGDDKDGIKEVDLGLDYDRFYDIAAGDKQFYHPNVIDICNFTVPIEDKRKTTFYFDSPMEKTCTLTIDLPAGFEVETLPVNQQLKFSYGSYDVSYKYDAVKNQVTSTSKFIITNQAIPAAKYTELQQYLDNIKKAENKKLVIRRKA